MKKAIAIFLCFLVYQLVASCLAVVIDKAFPCTRLDLAVLQVYALVPCGCLTAYVLMRLGLLRRHARLGRGRLTMPAFVDLLILVCLLAFGTSLIFEALQLDDGGSEALFYNLSHDPFCIVVLVLIAPLLEEVFFRAGIARQLVLSGLHPYVAALLTAAAFAAVHLNWAQALPAFILGFALTLCYFSSGNLLLCTLIHVINNGCAVIEMNLPHSQMVDEVELASDSFSKGILIVLLATFCLWRLFVPILKDREALSRLLSAEADDSSTDSNPFMPHEDRND